MDAQLVSIKSLEPGPLQTRLANALTQVLSKINRGRHIIPICVMDSIEDVFEEQDLIKKLARHQHYLVRVDGHVGAWMKHQKVQTIVIPDSAHKSDKA
jgi:hypothetical protein